MPPRTPLEVNVDLPWPAYLPRDYVPGQKLRIEVYRRLARVRDPEKLDDFRQELRDRYGPLPEPAEWLLRTAEVRLDCVAVAGRRRSTATARTWCSATATRQGGPAGEAEPAAG